MTRYRIEKESNRWKSGHIARVVKGTRRGKNAVYCAA